MTILEATDIGISFGGVKAVDGVSFSVGPGQILSIIGPNGAGKTTLFNVVSGVYMASRGTIGLSGEDVTGLAPHRLAARGLVANLPEPADLPAHDRLRERDGRPPFAREVQSLAGAVPAAGGHAAEPRDAGMALGLLEDVGLQDTADIAAGSLPYGACKRLEIARALAAEPRVLLLDEPAAGCNAVETEEIDHLIRQVADRGIAVVLVEHDMKLVMKISDRILVLERGRPLAEGTPREVRDDPAVLEAYLGQHGAREAARA